MPISSSETKSRKGNADDEIEEKENYAEGPLQAVPKPANWQSASLMAPRNLIIELGTMGSKCGRKSREEITRQVGRFRGRVPVYGCVIEAWSVSFPVELRRHLVRRRPSSSAPIRSRYVCVRFLRERREYPGASRTQALCSFPRRG